MTQAGELDDRGGAVVLAGQGQRCQAGVVGQVERGAVVREEFHDGVQPPRPDDVQRRFPAVVDRVDVGPELQRERDGFERLALRLLWPLSHPTRPGRHPNICIIHEINETDDGQLYLVMAHYEGETLKERIARGPLELDAALDIATQELADRATKKSGHTGRHWVYKDSNPSY